MKPRHLVVVALPMLALFLSPSRALAQAAPTAPPSDPCPAGQPPGFTKDGSGTLQVADVVPGATSKLVPTASNLANVAVQAGPNGTQFLVAITPFYLVPHPCQGLKYVPVFSETKVAASYSTSTQLTTAIAGVSLWNPFAVQGARAGDIWKKAAQVAGCGASLAPVLTAISVATRSPEQPDLLEWLRFFQAWSKDADDKSLDQDRKSQTEKLPQDLREGVKKLFALKAILPEKSKAAEAALATAQTALATAQTALATAQDQVVESNVVFIVARELASTSDPNKAVQDARAKASKAAEDTLARKKIERDARQNDVNSAQEGLQSAQNKAKQANDDFLGQITALQALYDQQIRICLGTKYQVAAWRNLFRTAEPRIDATVGFDLYPSGVGANPLDKTGMTIAPLEGWGGVRTELSFTFRPSERVELGLDAAFRHIRPSGAAYTQFANYEGGAIFIEGLLWSPLVVDPDPRARNQADAKAAAEQEEANRRVASTDYMKSGTLPGVSLGVSVQALFCQGFLNCMPAQSSSTTAQISGESVTPFLDYKDSNAVQFRLSLPITRSHTVVSTVYNVTPTVSAVTAFVGL
jgi:hypothetical protein